MKYCSLFEIVTADQWWIWIWSDEFEFEVMNLNLKWWIWIWSDEFEFEVMNLNLKWWIWIWSKEFEFDIWFIIGVALVGHRKYDMRYDNHNNFILSQLAFLEKNLIIRL
jgi:hypothetical protein